MTRQIEEIFIYKGREYGLSDDWPFVNYFRLSRVKTKFLSPHTGLWRGYVGTWKIIDNRFYLIGLDGKLHDGSDATIATFFPASPDRAFAYWYSGTIRLPVRSLLSNILWFCGFWRYGCRSVGERCFKIECGIVTNVYVRKDGEKEELPSTLPDMEGEPGYLRRTEDRPD